MTDQEIELRRAIAIAEGEAQGAAVGLGFFVGAMPGAAAYLIVDSLAAPLGGGVAAGLALLAGFVPMVGVAAIGLVVARVYLRRGRR